MAAKHQDLNTLIRKKLAERERLMKQIRQIDIEVEAMLGARQSVSGLQTLNSAIDEFRRDSK